MDLSKILLLIISVIFISGCTESPPYHFTIISDQHITIHQTTSPTAVNCGTNPIVTNKSTDTTGEITVGSGAGSSCTIVFNMTWSNMPQCVVSEHTSVSALKKDETKTNLTITGASLAGDKIDWICMEFV